MREVNVWGKLTYERSQFMGKTYVQQRPVYGENLCMAEANVWGKLMYERSQYMGKTYVWGKPMYERSLHMGKAIFIVKASLWGKPIYERGLCIEPRLHRSLTVHVDREVGGALILHHALHVDLDQRGRGDLVRQQPARRRQHLLHGGVEARSYLAVDARWNNRQSL